MSLTTYIRRSHPKCISTPWIGMTKKVLQLETARVNLVKCCEVLAEANVNYRVVFGSLLGLYRDGDLIPHDMDMDLAIQHSDIPKLIKGIDALAKEGFTVVRYSNNQLVSVGKDGDYIDIYIFTSGRCNIYNLSDADFKSDCTVTLLDTELKTIADPEAFFRKYYGGDWKTPIKGLHAHTKHGSRK